MASGPIHTPARMRALRGNPGKRPIGPAVALEVAVAALPTPPDFLTAYGLEEWHRVAPMIYRVGLLTDADVAHFAAYCRAFGQWRDIEETINEIEEHPERHPEIKFRDRFKLMAEARAACREMLRYGREFGLTPSARASIAGNTAKARSSKFDDLLS